MSVELRHLRYFVAVAEELSFTRAAERLHMAQPPLSTQIQRLEKQLGVQLFDRAQRRIRLAPAGVALLPEARRLLVEVDQTLRAVRRVGHGTVGRLTIGFVPSASNSALPAALLPFRSEYPDVELYLREMQPDNLIAALHAGGVDVTFLYLPFADDALAQHVVARETMVAALPSEHRLAANNAVRVRDLRDEPFVMPAQYRMPGLHAQVTDTCRRAGFAPRAVQKDVWLMQTIIGLVAAGLGVALVPASVEHLHRTGVAYRPLRGAAPTVEMAALWRRDDPSPTLANFREILYRTTPQA